LGVFSSHCGRIWNHLCDWRIITRRTRHSVMFFLACFGFWNLRKKNLESRLDVNQGRFSNSMLTRLLFQRHAIRKPALVLVFEARFCHICFELRNFHTKRKTNLYYFSFTCFYETLIRHFFVRYFTFAC